MRERKTLEDHINKMIDTPGMGANTIKVQINMYILQTLLDIRDLLKNK